jgi:hypothetical protein
MLDRDDSDDRPLSSNVHDHWLTMQSAYVEYTRATEALADAPGGERERLEDRRRLAFERYMETRIEFLESRFDECYPPGTQLPQPVQRTAPPAAHATWIGSTWIGSPALCILILVLTSVAAFSFARTRNHVRELEASRDDLRARLNQTSDGLQSLAQKLNASTLPSPPPIQQVDAPAPAPPPRAAVRKRPAAKQLKRHPVRRIPARTVLTTQTHWRRRG